MVEIDNRIWLIAQQLTESADEAESSLESGGKVLLFALGLLLMISLLTRSMIRAYQRSRKRSPKKDVKRIRAQADKAMPRTDLTLLDAPASYGRWHAEMNDIARSVEAEIESKLRRLQATIRLADETSERLERAIVESRQILANEDSSSLRSSEVQTKSESDDSSSDGMEHLPAANSIENQINALARANTSAQEIANRLGLALGDVELIMSTQEIPEA